MSLEHRQREDRSRARASFLDGTKKRRASDPFHGACDPVWHSGPRYDDDEHDDEHDDDDDDTSGRTTPENEVRASTMRHGKYRPVYRVEATMRSEGTGTATTGSSHRQRRIAVEPCKQRRHKVGRTRFREGPPIGTPSPVHGGTTSPAPTRNSIPRLLVCLSPVPRPSLSRALTATTLPLLQRTVCAREQSDSGAATQWRRQLRVYAGFVERRHFKLVAWTAAFFGVLLCHRGNECIGDVGWTGNAERVARRSNHCSFGEVIMLDRGGR